jgi:hypothetical protein
MGLPPLVYFQRRWRRRGRDVAVRMSCVPPQGDGGGRGVKTPRTSTSSSCLDAREVVVVADSLKSPKKNPHPARVWMRGWWCGCRHVETNHLWLAFECEGGGVVAGPPKSQRTRLRLAFGPKGGGSGGKRVEVSKKSTSGSYLDAREEVVVANASKSSKRPTSGSCLDAREVAAGNALKTSKISIFTSGSRLGVREVVAAVSV